MPISDKRREQFIQIATVLLALAAVIAAMTPSKADDTVVLLLQKVLEELRVSQNAAQGQEETH